MVECVRFVHQRVAPEIPVPPNYVSHLSISPIAKNWRTPVHCDLDLLDLCQSRLSVPFRRASFNSFILKRSEYYVPSRRDPGRSRPLLLSALQLLMRASLKLQKLFSLVADTMCSTRPPCRIRFGLPDPVLQLASDANMLVMRLSSLDAKRCTTHGSLIGALNHIRCEA